MNIKNIIYFCGTVKIAIQNYFPYIKDTLFEKTSSLLSFTFQSSSLFQTALTGDKSYVSDVFLWVVKTL